MVQAVPSPMLDGSRPRNIDLPPTRSILRHPSSKPGAGASAERSVRVRSAYVHLTCSFLRSVRAPYSGQPRRSCRVL